MNGEATRKLLQENAAIKMDGVILAGGKGIRMNRKMKALLPIGRDLIINRITARMAVICNHLIVVVGSLQQLEVLSGLGIQTVLDPIPDQGPLAAFKTALDNLADDGVVWITASDMPFISVEAAQYMSLIMERSGSIAVVPEIDGRLHPLHAIYRKECRGQAANCLAEGQRGMKDMLNQLDFIRITKHQFAMEGIDPRFTVNVNTPEEYCEALLMEDAYE
ncbi:MAG: molybdenum cofactor guanylyltransferase [Candidatus Pristimantibacillus sp.]